MKVLSKWFCSAALMQLMFALTLATAQAQLAGETDEEVHEDTPESVKEPISECLKKAVLGYHYCMLAYGHEWPADEIGPYKETICVDTAEAVLVLCRWGS